MALFFDAEWFDAQLAARRMSRADVARALGLGAEQIAELWKDQRELSVRDVRALSVLLGSTVQEIALRAGVSTPVPADPPADATAALAELNERLARVERGLIELKALILDLRDRPR
ncbi:MAG TPA: helix-turn-helix domain-containing protein [Rhizomicrobium sp.]|jgi:transcriptional regulator with XRE-family HTH domain